MLNKDGPTKDDLNGIVARLCDIKKGRRASELMIDVSDGAVAGGFDGDAAR